MTEKTVAGVKTTYRYNLDGRLSEIRDHNDLIVAQYQYDPFGRRISKHLPQTSERIYFFYSDEGLIAEYYDAGELIQSYGYRPDSLFTTDPIFTHRPDFITQAKGGYVYYIHDYLATPQKLITETGRKVWEAQANVFGKTLITNNEFRNPLRFPGQYKDEESELRYNWKRYYSFSLGRYITNDPIGLSGGLNTYNYANSLPTINYDVNGEAIILAPIVWNAIRQGIITCARSRVCGGIIMTAAVTSTNTGQQALNECFDYDYPDVPGWLDGLGNDHSTPMPPGWGPDDDDDLLPPSNHNHHIYPQQHRNWFSQRGIDIDRYTIRVDRTTHLRGIHGRGQSGMPGRWNSRWDDFIRRYPNASARETQDFANRLLREYGLNNLPIRPY
jgi:RHS repeat-associated protein